MQNLQLPPAIWPALATIVLGLASEAFGADQVGTALMAALGVLSTLVRMWQEAQPGDQDAVSTRGATDERRSYVRRVLLG